MVEIQLSRPFCNVDKGCAPLQVLTQRIDNVEEDKKRINDSLDRLWARVDTTLETIHVQMDRLLLVGYGLIGTIICGFAANALMQYAKTHHWWPF